MGDIYDTCVADCSGREDGDYPSCLGCSVYVTCSNGAMTDNRPCPLETVWHEELNRCDDPMDNLDCGGTVRNIIV